MRWDRDFVIVISGIICNAQLFRVKELTHITAYLPRVIFTGYTTMIVNTAARGLQLLLFLFAGFATHINLYGGQVGPLECNGIAAADLPDVRTVSLANTDCFLLASISPLRPRPFLVRIYILSKEAYRSRRVFLFPKVPACRVIASAITC